MKLMDWTALISQCRVNRSAKLPEISPNKNIGAIRLTPINATCSEEEDALTRMTSTSLRHGADIHHVVQQLEKVKGDMTSFAKSMARALKKYIPDGKKEQGECPECNAQDALIRQEGCITCTQCGYSKCN